MIHHNPGRDPIRVAVLSPAEVKARIALKIPGEVLTGVIKNSAPGTSENSPCTGRFLDPFTGLSSYLS